MTPSIPTIRPFDPDDLPAMQRVRQAAFEPVFRSFRDIVGERIAVIAFADADTEQAKLLDDICAAGSGHHVVVMTLDGEIVGFVSFTADIEKRTGEIGLNAVHPDHAGRGFGTRMYAHVLARMRELGMAVATVGTGADPSRATARRAYEKAGFNAAIPSLCRTGCFEPPVRSRRLLDLALQLQGASAAFYASTSSVTVVGGGTGNPSAFSPLMWKRIASLISASTASTAGPVATHPGRSGT
jgi:ribosomal protein S18 acetylase RimI-like enzyme